VETFLFPPPPFFFFFPSSRDPPDQGHKRFCIMFRGGAAVETCHVLSFFFFSFSLILHDKAALLKPVFARDRGYFLSSPPPGSERGRRDPCLLPPLLSTFYRSTLAAEVLMALGNLMPTSLARPRKSSSLFFPLFFSFFEGGSGDGRYGAFSHGHSEQWNLFSPSFPPFFFFL